MIDLLANERTRHSLVGGCVQRRRRHSGLLLPKISYETVKTKPAHVQRKKPTFAKSEVCEVPDRGLQLTLPAKKCSGKNNIEMENEAHIST